MRATCFALVCILSTGVSAQDWLEKQRPDGSGRLAYDSARGRLVRQGSQTWEWNGPDWVARAPSVRPGGGVMVYDEARSRTILWNHDTWAWDGVDWTLLATATRPWIPQGGTCCMAYDPVRERALLYGAWLDGQFGIYTHGAWEWNGADWESVGAPFPMPPRLRGSLAYDPVRQRIVMFGGDGGVPLIGLYSTYDDLWEWDGMQWTEVTQPVRPPARSSHVLATDPVRNRVVLFGGVSFPAFGPDTWEWDGSAWTQMAPMTSPPNRSGYSATYDAARGRVVLYGGRETWDWDGTDWALRATSRTPPLRSRYQLVYDTARGVSVLSGGPEGTVGDTWEWDGLRWWRRTPSQSPPVSRTVAMAYDAGRQRVVWFAGDTATPAPETWEWDGAVWTQRATVQQPPGGDRYEMVYDAAAQRVLLITTARAFTTWEWDGNVWSQRTPAAEPAIGVYALAFDRSRQRVLLFGTPNQGGTETWEWDGQNWLQMTPAVTPPDRSGHRMVYHAARGRVVLFGGRRSGRPLGDTWEWDGANWSMISPEQSPPARAWFGFAYDDRREQAVLFGGEHQPGLGLRGDTWVYGLTTPAAAERYGNGCKGSSGAPVVDALGRPIMGTPGYALDTLFNPPATAAVFLLAGRQAALPFGGCTLWVDPAALLLSVPAVTNAAGFASLGLPLPARRELFGIQLFIQSASADPTGPFGGLVFSNGLRLQLGE